MTAAIRAVIFDLDGLVLDTETTYIRAWQAATTEMGFGYSAEFWTSLSGLSGNAVMERLREHSQHRLDIQRFQQLSSRHWLKDVQLHGISVKPGLMAVLEVIQQRNLPFCLATNSPQQAARQCLNWAGLAQTFPTIVGSDAVSRAKPAADIFWAAAKALNQTVEHCLVLEDSAIGIAAAVAAGAPCVMIPSSQPVDAWAAQQANFLCDDLFQVADLISVKQRHPL